MYFGALLLISGRLLNLGWIGAVRRRVFLRVIGGWVRVCQAGGREGLLMGLGPDPFRVGLGWPSAWHL
jgi:hypothetical protein